MRRAATHDLATAAKGVTGGVRATISLSLHWILRIVPDAQVSPELPKEVRFCRRKACLTALHAFVPS